VDAFAATAHVDNVAMGFGRRIRIATDSRYQLAAEPMDERWVGKNPIMNSVRVAKGMIC